MGDMIEFHVNQTTLWKKNQKGNYVCSILSLHTIFFLTTLAYIQKW